MDRPPEAPPDPVILVVEDEPLVRTFAAQILMDAGYRVFEACEAADAITILEGRNDIHALLTDIEMPGDMDGLALAVAVYQRWPDIAILVTSGRIRPDVGALPIGAKFIAKPYRPTEMIGLLADLVAQHHQWRPGDCHG